MSRYMDPIHTIVYDGVPLSDFGLYVSGNATYSSAERDYEIEEVPGRSGDLLFDNKKYKNIEVPYRAFIVERFVDNIEGLRNFLSSNFGYKRIEDSYNPNTYRLGFLSRELVVETANLNEAGAFDLSFNCKPQRFLKSGDVPIVFDQNGGLVNPTYNESKPIIRIYGNGKIRIGSYEVTVSDNPNEYVDIDCDLQEAYFGTLNCNRYISINTDSFLELHNGFNGVELDGVSKIVITPKWWII